MNTPKITAVINYSCVKCGAVERNKRGACKLCAREKIAAWRALNPEKVKAQNAAWRAANTERHRVNNAAWRAANTEKVRAKNAAWQKINSEKNKVSCAAWKIENREATRVYQRNRRARILASLGVLSLGLSKKLFALQKGKCACCKQTLGASYHLDHIMPLALGGANTDDNMQLLRQRCNNQKHAKHPIDFMQSRGFLL